MVLNFLNQSIECYVTDKISDKTIADHNLSEKEYNLIPQDIRRVSNLLELGIFSVNVRNTVHINQQKMAKNFTN